MTPEYLLMVMPKWVRILIAIVVFPIFLVICGILSLSGSRVDMPKEIESFRNFIRHGTFQ